MTRSVFSDVSSLSAADEFCMCPPGGELDARCEHKDLRGTRRCDSHRDVQDPEQSGAGRGRRGGWV